MRLKSRNRIKKTGDMMFVNWTPAQIDTYNEFYRWRRGIAKIHDRPESPIVTEVDEGTVYIETDGYAWFIDPDGTLNEIS